MTFENFATVSGAESKNSDRLAERKRTSRKTLRYEPCRRVLNKFDRVGLSKRARSAIAQRRLAFGRYLIFAVYAFSSKSVYVASPEEKHNVSFADPALEI